LNVEPQYTFQAQSLLGGYYTGNPLQEKLKLRILGKLNERLSISYDIEQQPDMPDKSDVKVTYDRTELTFGNMQATFGGNEFVSTSKYLNGVMITSKDNWYDLTFVPSAKLKSETQQLVTQYGNNTKGPYNLGHGSIIEGSERIELNNVPLTKGTDYTIDYFSGKITFSRLLSTADEFKYSYEFTNILDMFFPTVSKRDFIGLRTSITVDPTLLGMPAKKIEKAVRSTTEYFPTVLQIPEEKITKEVVTLPPNVTMESGPGTYSVTIKGIPVITLHDIVGETPAELRCQLVGKRLKAIVEAGLSTSEISVSNINGEYVVLARERSIATATKGEADANNITNLALAIKWRDGIIAGLMSSGETETRLITPEIVVKEYEWESTGTYKLKNIPAIPYSEKIIFQGTQLKKFEDYLINYQDGTITLLNPNLPTALEPMSIEYQYIEVAPESETLPGAGKGPYILAHENIIEASESVYVSNIPYIRELDYSIDYEQGKITFYTLIPQTANIVIKYKYLVMTSPPPPVTQQIPRSLTVGVSYLKESGKRGATPPSIAATETFSGDYLIKQDNTAFLANRPLTSTGEVEIRKNNVLLKYGVDYVVPTVDATTGQRFPSTRLPEFMCDIDDKSDGLQAGIIYFFGTFSSTDEIVISYEYSKWSKDRYSGSGLTAQPRYTIGNARNIVAGQEELWVWRKSDPTAWQTKLTRNLSFDASGVKDYSINYSDSYITFNKDTLVVYDEHGNKYTVRLDEINFSVVYRFVAIASVSERPLSHDVLGFDSTFKVGDYLNLEGSFAKSKTDQVFTTVRTTESFNGNGQTIIFNLNSTGPIVEDSEMVRSNGIILNRDEQYSFYFDTNSSGKYGVLTFLGNLAPATSDVISVDYDFSDPTALATKLSEKQGTAYKVGIGVKPFSNMEVAADYKKVDLTFAPMGGIAIPLGSEYKHAYTKMTPLPSLLPGFWFSGDLKEGNVPIKSYPDRFLHSYDRNLSSGFNPYGIAQIDFGYRDYSTIDDKLPGSSVRDNDYQSLAYSLSVAPKPLLVGEFGWTNRNDVRRSISYTDTKDKLLPKDTLIDYYHTNNAFDFTKRFRFTFDYQENQPSTISYEANTRAPSRARTTDRSRTIDRGYFLNSDLNYWNLKRLSAYVNRLEHEENIELPETKHKETLNETYHADCVPIDQLSLSVDRNQQETLTITTRYGNPKSERLSATTKLTPYSGTSLGWSGSKDEALQENGVKTSGNANTYSIAHTLLSGSNYRLSTSYNLSASLRSAPSGSEEVTTDSRSFSQDYNLSINPISVWTVSSGFLQEDYTNKNDSSLSPVDTNSQSQTTRVGTLYKVTEDLDLSGNYSVKVTSTVRPEPMSAHKSLIDLHAVYKVFTYGMLNFDWSQEDNGGEILGGVFVSQDFTKVLRSLSLNFALPQSEKMILSSVVLAASVKWVDYTDRINPDNSFPATVMMFEGTLNF